MKNHVLLIFITILLCVKTACADSISGKDILLEVDKNLCPDDRVGISSLVINGARASRTVKCKTWAAGMDKSYTQYLAPPREAGTKMLKLKDQLWTYDPTTDRTILIAGHMLRQSMLGSDISYEDFMQDSRLSSLYDAEITGDEKVGDRSCYVLILKAKVDDVAYYSRRLWVDRERFLPLRQELKGKSGVLLKTLTVNEVFKVGERWYPKRMLYKDVSLEGSGTVIIIESIDFNVKIPDSVFNKASLKR
ncbi:MAG: outer membrane lipoprotein-sorting protein [Candidatus Xenobiia bacterium LiM19]